jgi:hypothetical protein
MWVKKPKYLGSLEFRTQPQYAGLSFAGEAHETMIEDLLLLFFCLVLAVGGIATVVWGLATGRFFSIDGLWLGLISLTISAVFGGNIAWSIYTGELRRILHPGGEKQEAKGEK